MLLPCCSAPPHSVCLPHRATRQPHARRSPVRPSSGRRSFAFGERLIADSIVVEKQRRRLTLYQADSRSGPIALQLGKQPVGDKREIGDNRTPEGLFHIDFKNPNSKYHMALHISYPDAAHAAKARSRGVAAGGDVMIHGLPPAYATLGAKHSEYDWTEGCIAVTNAEIEEIWRAVPNGSPIQIKP